VLPGAVARWSVVSVGGCLYLSYALVTFSVGNTISRYFTDNVRFLPYYSEVLMPGRSTLINYERYGEREFAHPDQMNAPLNYPQQKNLFCHTQKNPLNLVIIVIDAWRFDMLNATVTPFLTQFASHAWNFQQHYSGGNATGPGIFSLFYGVPATYWTAMETQHQGPVLIHELLRQQYQMGIFTSATLKLPAFDKTVFTEISHLRLGTRNCKNAYERDVAITQEFKKFVTQAKRKPQPFFGFLFYDSAHSYCDIDNVLKPFQPVVADCNHLQLNNSSAIQPYFNRYQNALLLVDAQIREVMAFLTAQQMLANTVVMITGDHGEEFNDNHLNYWGHASNFTSYQIQTPLIVYWPGQRAKTFTHATSHFDIAPTLLTQLLGCSAPVKNYSVGQLLQDTHLRPYFLVGSYIDFGVREGDRITTIYPLGNYEIDALNGAPLGAAHLNIPVMQGVFFDLRRFYQRNL
jgi:membrane-anchored protein YejM (alkaline phosphatase superfamily)